MNTLLTVARKSRAHLVSITAILDLAMGNVKIKFLAPPTSGARATQICVTCLSQLKGPPQGRTETSRL
jgi:hypothetical protein